MEPRGQGWLGERQATEASAAPASECRVPGARVMVWNILHGGGTRRTPEIALTLAASAPDVVVLIEFRPTLGGQLLGVLADRGLVHTRWATVSGASCGSPSGGNRVVVASRWPLEDGALGHGDIPPGLESRMMTVGVSALDLVLTGVHLPDASQPDLARAGWDWLARKAIYSQDSCHLVIGDLNASRDGVGHRRAEVPGYAAHAFGRMWTAGYRDAHALGAQTPEITWKARSGKGLRLDHALVSGPLQGRVREATYLHGPRNERVSDHSALLVALGEDETLKGARAGQMLKNSEKQT